MSAPAVPSLADGVAAVFRLQMTRLLRGRKARLAVVALVLVLVAVLGARYAASADPVEVVREGADWGFFTLLVFLLPFLFTAGSIAEEVEARTFTYLSSRPAGRLATTLGKYLAGMALAIGLLWAGLLVMHVLAFVTEPSAMVDELTTTLRAMGAIALLALFYGALCMFWGSLVPEAAGIVSTLHLALIELLVTWMPGIFRFVSMNYHARQLAGLPKREVLGGAAGRIGQALQPPDVPAYAAVLTLVIVALLTLLCTVLVVRFSEYRFGKA